MRLFAARNVELRIKTVGQLNDDGTLAARGGRHWSSSRSELFSVRSSTLSAADTSTRAA